VSVDNTYVHGNRGSIRLSGGVARLEGACMHISASSLSANYPGTKPRMS
jgi:hypothetical protein